MSDQEIRERLIKMEVILGDERRGLIAELKDLRQAVDDLKAFQIKVMSAFGLVAVAAQVGIKFFL